MWLDIICGIILLLSPLNMRYQMSKARRKLVARHGDIERFDRFLRSRILQLCYIVLLVLGIVAIAIGLIHH